MTGRRGRRLPIGAVPVIQACPANRAGKYRRRFEQVERQEWRTTGRPFLRRCGLLGRRIAQVRRRTAVARQCHGQHGSWAAGNAVQDGSGRAGRAAPTLWEQPSVPGGPTLLIVPAPIKRGYIWDLLPHVSVVRRYLEAGFRVYMTEWIEPVEPADDDGGKTGGKGRAGSPLGLADYADRLILRCADAIAAAGDGDRIFIAGHSLGGTLATIFSSLHADRIRGLVVVEAPLHFGPDSGVFAPVVAGAPHAAALRELFGNIPGTFLNMVSAKASPREFNWDRRMDMIASLADPRAFQAHLAVERWTLDEFPLPGRLFEELIEQLYREDRFARGTLRSTAGRRPQQALRHPCWRSWATTARSSHRRRCCR